MSDPNQTANLMDNYTYEGVKALESRGLGGREHDVELIKAKAAELFGLYSKFSTNAPGTDAQRHYALAKTNLEQSVMWMIKGISRSH